MASFDWWRPVERALITHGHTDHARDGMRAYLATQTAALVTRRRLGADARIDTIPFDEVRRIGGVDVSFHPAGHFPVC